jgi:hypothetical protein
VSFDRRKGLPAVRRRQPIYPSSFGKTAALGEGHSMRYPVSAEIWINGRPVINLSGGNSPALQSGCSHTDRDFGGLPTCISDLAAYATAKLPGFLPKPHSALV